MPIAYSYIRFSTPAQAKGDSLRRQLQKSQRFADKHGLTLDTSFRDTGVSAFKGDHRMKGALSLFLARVEDGTIARGSYLIVENLDRLSREQIFEAVTLFIGIIKAGIILAVLSDDMVYSRESIIERPHDLQISITGFIKANKESKDKAERLREVWDAKRSNLIDNPRRKFTRQGPAWLDLIADDPIQEPLIGEWAFNDRADDVRRCFQLALAGLGRDLIATTMANEGIKALKHGDGWHGSTVLTLLKDRRVIGEFQPHQKIKTDGRAKRVATGSPIKGYFPAVVEEATFYAVQKALKARYSGATPATKGKVPNLFRSIARCSCGRSMEFRDKTGPRNRTERSRYLICSGARRSERLCGNDHHYVYAVSEALVLDWVTDIRLSDHELDHMADQARRLSGKIAERDDLRGRIARAMDAWERETDDGMREDMLARIRANRVQLDPLAREIAALEVEVTANKRSVIDDRRATLKHVRDCLVGLEGDELFAARARLASALRQVVDHVEFGGEGVFNVFLFGGKKAYRFDSNGFRHIVDLDGSADWLRFPAQEEKARFGWYEQA